MCVSTKGEEARTVMRSKLPTSTNTSKNLSKLQITNKQVNILYLYFDVMDYFVNLKSLMQNLISIFKCKFANSLVNAA